MQDVLSLLACLTQVVDDNFRAPNNPDLEILAAAGNWMECRAFAKLMHSLRPNLKLGGKTLA